MNPGEYQKMFDLEDRYWWFVARRRLALNLVRQFAPGDRLLDVGCGTGILLQEYGPSAVGSDFSPLALEFCRRRGLESLVACDAQMQPFATNSFDAVVALDVLEHVPDDAAAFAEIARVLRPGGVVVLSVPAFRALWGPHDVALHHFRRYTRREINGRLRAVGLEPVALSYAIFWLFPFVLGSRLLEKLPRCGPAKASLPPVPDGLNRALIRLVESETTRIAQGGSWPWGSSVVAVGRKLGGVTEALDLSPPV